MLDWYPVDEYFAEDHPSLVLPEKILLLHGSRHGRILDRDDESRYPEYDDRVLVFGKEKLSFFVGQAAYHGSGRVPFMSLVFQYGFGRHRWSYKLIQVAGFSNERGRHERRENH